VSAERFEDSTLPERSFDLIHSYHVIEHVAHPRLFMENALRLLADDGLILIETPSTKGLDFALFKRKHWGGYHAPRHWTLFRRKSLQMPVERCGGVVRASGACTSSCFSNWTCHSLVMGIAGRKIADTVFPPTKAFEGGVWPFVLLGSFAVLERGLVAATDGATACGR